MASANLSAEQECSLCWKIHSDPVMMSCGHTFCRVCIDHKLDTQEVSGDYFCPACRKRFRSRPALQRNLPLPYIAQQYQEDSKVFCTYCLDSSVPAVKACLLCDAYLCDKHLTAHNTAPEHVLLDPTISLQSRKCSTHKELIKYYCTEDDACVCMSCFVIGGHKGHEMESLDEASGKKKETLRNVLQKLVTRREKMEERVRSLQEHGRKVEKEAAGDTERVTAKFLDLRRRLEDLEERVLREISGRAERVSMSIVEMIRVLEIKKDKLSKKMHHIEELCNMTDPLTVLQESDTGDLCDTEDGDDEDRERHDELFHDGGSLDAAVILHTGLSDIITEVNVFLPIQEAADILLDVNTADNNLHISDNRKNASKSNIDQKRPNTKDGDDEDRERHDELLHDGGGLDVAGILHTGLSDIITGVNVYFPIQEAADILLDVNTAHNKLVILDDRKTVFWSHRNQKRPKTPERFEGYTQVLSSQGFSSGRHSWDVDVGGSGDWKVGVCYPSIDRKGEKSMIGRNEKSWCLDRNGNQYSVIHDKKELHLPVNISSNRVRVYLDYEAGRISFYDLCDPIRLLHTFITTFTEPLHAGLDVYEGCIKIGGKNWGM